MAFFGLKLGLDLEMQAAHPHQKFQGVPPPPGNSPSLRHKLLVLRSTVERAIDRHVTVHSKEGAIHRLSYAEDFPGVLSQQLGAS